MIQLTIIKITGYGPWTLTLGSDREHELQMLQSQLYNKLQELFSKKNCLVFLNRSDEYFSVTNSLSLDEHIAIQKELESSFDVRLSMSIGYGENPYDANLDAYEAKKSQKFLNEKYSIFGTLNGHSEHSVTIMHLDVDDLTSKRKKISPYDTSSLMFKIYSRMSEYFLSKNSLTFFMGGDNFMVVTNFELKNFAKEFIKIGKDEFQVVLNCGIGTAKTSRDAVKLATKSLDTIRQIRDSGKEKPDIYELN
ncbi:MAG: GTP cyclohydrolase IIa [Candidatus Nitrosopelagicus sp.]|nr:GTP cyclohydrolase IIa [Candidatus Nitrosopelagicus sp.]